MPFELVCTSVPRGLRPTQSGFCAVAQTEGMSDALTEQLESLSGYRHLKVGADPETSGNPVIFSHTVVIVGRRAFHVVSRVADAGLDHTKRSNHIAHHVAFAPDEVPSQGPAWVCQHWPFKRAWSGAPQYLPPPHAPTGKAKLGKCEYWQAATGDAGWGGVLAATAQSAEPACIVCPAHIDALPLVAEAMCLLDSSARWKVTFSTYYAKFSAADCRWRCVRAGSPEARAAGRGLILRLDQSPPGAIAPSGPFAEAARTGVAPSEALIASPAPVPPPPSPPAASPWEVAPREVPLSLSEVEVGGPPGMYVPASFSEPPPPVLRNLPEEPAPIAEEMPPEPEPESEESFFAANRPLLLGLAIGLGLALVPTVIAIAKSSRLSEARTELAAEKADKDKLLTAEQLKVKERDTLLIDEKKTVKRVSDELEQKKKDLIEETGKYTRAEATRKQAEADLKAKNPQLAKLKMEIEAEKGLRAAAEQDRENFRKQSDDFKAQLARQLVSSTPVPLALKKSGVSVRTPLQDPKVLDVFGVQDFFDVNKGMSPAVAEVKRKGAKPEEAPGARLELKPDGEVSLSGDFLEHPKFPLAVLRVTTGSGQAVYLQFVRPLALSHGGPLAPKKDTNQYVYEPKPHDPKEDPRLKELLALVGNEALVPGAGARVKYGTEEYTLLPVAEDKPELEYRLPGDGSQLKLSLTIDKEKKVVVTATGALAKGAAPLELLALEIGRRISSKESPTIWQEVFRVR